MKERTAHIITFYMLLLISCMLFYLAYENKELRDRFNVCKYSETYNKFKDSKNNTKLNGLYISKGEYYCVNIEDREPKEITKTEAHEYCHYLIIDGKEKECSGEDCWEHFCEGYKEVEDGT